MWCFRFSFNLCVDVCPCPEVVAFHFKTMLDSNTIVHNHKDITWQEETVSANTWVHGPGMNETITNIHILYKCHRQHISRCECVFLIYLTGAEFTIQLVLTRDHVRVYDEQMLRYELEHKYDIQDAKTLQVWDDVEYISECTFKYGRPRN